MSVDQISFKRILIITDSLGCPRKENEVENTWVDKVLKYCCGKKFIVYTYCYYGLYFKKIPLEYVREINPDILFIQVGVVDACRRVMSRPFEQIVSRIPIVSRIVHAFAQKFHYQITKLRNVHYSSTEEVRNACKELVKRTKGDLYFIKIAPSSSVMENKAYNFSRDVAQYNETICSVVEESENRIRILNPYKDVSAEDIFLYDGHHLNEKGSNLVYACVKDILENGGKVK